MLFSKTLAEDYVRTTPMVMNSKAETVEDTLEYLVVQPLHRLLRAASKVLPFSVLSPGVSPPVFSFQRG